MLVAFVAEVGQQHSLHLLRWPLTDGLPLLGVHAPQRDEHSPCRAGCCAQTLSVLFPQGDAAFLLDPAQDNLVEPMGLIGGCEVCKQRSDGGAAGWCISWAVLGSGVQLQVVAWQAG